MYSIENRILTIIYTTDQTQNIVSYTYVIQDLLLSVLLS